LLSQRDLAHNPWAAFWLRREFAGDRFQEFIAVPRTYRSRQRHDLAQFIIT
jgi:hypothetical protein